VHPGDRAAELGVCSEAKGVRRRRVEWISTSAYRSNVFSASTNSCSALIFGSQP
jgi:hypothetical protein